MGIYINKGHEAFRSARNSEYVDKSWTDSSGEQDTLHRAEVQLCQPLPTFWQIDGGRDAGSLL